MMLAMIALLSFVSGCVTIETRPSECVWAKIIELSDATIEVLKRHELEQIVAHNEMVIQTCD